MIVYWTAPFPIWPPRCCHDNKHFFYINKTVRVYTLKLWSIQAICQETSTHSASKEHYPACLHLALGSPRPALQLVFGTVVQKGLILYGWEKLGETFLPHGTYQGLTARRSALHARSSANTCLPRRTSRSAHISSRSASNSPESHPRPLWQTCAI